MATDVAHAIPLALCAGLAPGVQSCGWALLRDLLIGSTPAALAGAIVSGRVPHRLLRTALGVVLLVVGLLMLNAV